MIDITGLDKAEVLAALYDRAKPQGMGMLHYRPEPMATDEAQRLLDKGDYFDYVHGRVMKVRLRADRNEFDEFLYDRDNGEDAAAEVVEGLREKQVAA